MTSWPCGVDLQGAVAGVALAARRLHHEEAVAVDRDVERIAGLLRSAPWLMSCQVARSCTKLTRRSAPREAAARCAPACRYSSNTAPSALKPVVLMLAMLLATTSSSRRSAICRDSPMRSAFSIASAPLEPAAAAPSRGRTAPKARRRALPSRRLAGDIAARRAKSENRVDIRCLDEIAGGVPGGKNGHFGRLDPAKISAFAAAESFR